MRNQWSFRVSPAENVGIELHFPSDWCADPDFSAIESSADESSRGGLYPCSSCRMRRSSTRMTTTLPPIAASPTARYAA